MTTNLDLLNGFLENTARRMERDGRPSLNAEEIRRARNLSRYPAFRRVLTRLFGAIVLRQPKRRPARHSATIVEVNFTGRPAPAPARRKALAS